MIIVSIASLFDKERLKCLCKLLSQLLTQDTMPWKVIVHLEGYPSIPRVLLENYLSCEFILEPISGGLSSFKSFFSAKDCIYISLDDDIIIMDNFISRVCQHMKHIGKSGCISYLAKFYPDLSTTPLYDDFVSIHFQHACPSYRPCHILGSGIAAFYSYQVSECYEFISKLDVPGIYRDMLVSFYLWLKGISILRPPSCSVFLKGYSCSTNCNAQKSFKNRQEVLDTLYKRGFLNPNSFGSLE